MLDFFSSIVNGIVFIVDYFVSIIASLYSFVTFSITVSFLPHMLVGFVPAFFGACIYFVLGAAMIKMILSIF